ncbi:MAG: hypothetical protein KGL39_00435 [Patescibacteria group bacterium]|nr:hypothetical protein [Patescibacteria group bacterium]
MKTLAQDQLQKLAGLLMGTRLNPYLVCKQEFGIDVTGDAVFDKLVECGGIFKCEECGYWLDLADRSDVTGYVCVLCMDPFESGE